MVSERLRLAREERSNIEKSNVGRCWSVDVRKCVGFGQHLFHCDKSVSAPLRNKFHALLKTSVANALAAPMRGVGLTVQESEPHEQLLRTSPTATDHTDREPGSRRFRPREWRAEQTFFSKTKMVGRPYSWMSPRHRA
jgi:hypothetical protein